jgi:hypothetical protein
MQTLPFIKNGENIDLYKSVQDDNFLDTLIKITQSSPSKEYLDSELYVMCILCGLVLLEQ